METIYAIVERLRQRVGEDSRLGWILEEDRDVPAEVLAQGWLPSEIRRRWKKTKPGVTIPEHLRRDFPASYVDLLARYGSLHWIAPRSYAGDLAHMVRNSGPEAFIAFHWPAYFAVIDVVVIPTAEEAIDGIEVFHDGTLTGAAFDNRVRNTAGEHLVVEDFDESSCESLIETPGVGTATFEQWLHRHVDAILDDLSR